VKTSNEVSKGQLTSEGNCGVFNSFNKPKQQFCPSGLGQKLKNVGSVFGRKEGRKFSF
jgi:hypothetical protein